MMTVILNIKVNIIMHHRYFVENEEEGPLYFTIGVNSGIIRTTQVLDREETAWHNITVMAAEVGKFTATTVQFRLFSVYLHVHPSSHPSSTVCVPGRLTCPVGRCSGSLLFLWRLNALILSSFPQGKNVYQMKVTEE